MLWVLVIYLISSFLNAAYFLPIVYKGFFCTEKESMFKGKIKEAPLFCVLPIVTTAAICVILFFYPQFFLDFANLMVPAG